MTTPPLPAPEEIRRIACLMLADLGDALVVTPALHALREKYPHAAITVIVRANVAPLLSHNPHIDALLIYRNDKAWGKYLLLWRLLGRRYDLWVDLHTPTFNTFCSNAEVFKRNAFLMRLAMPRYRAGFALAELAPFLTHPVPVPTDTELAGENIVDTTLRLLNQAGNRHYKKAFYLSDASRRRAAEVIEHEGLKPPLIGFFFGSKQPAEVWREDLAKAFLENLLERHTDISVLIFGGEIERPAAERMCASLPDHKQARVRNFAGRAHLQHTGALMERCSAIVTSNSGPMHMADGLNLPMVALFSSRNYLPIWLPINKQAIVLNHPVECSPCLAMACPLAHPCVDLISPAEVLVAFETLRDRIKANSNYP
ncbi:glycosyltransferase family 9 protein [Methylomonas sp. HYX-M1]|uniref:glycosyltransferase family 9 protein n=1 Tax=Methylomonas sp. HYX-M1 TaxID=3139307 RepID=UPI00345B5615